MIAFVALLILADPAVAEPTKPLWLLQRDVPARTMAVTFGTAKHKSYSTNATLSLACNGKGSGTAYLAVDVKSLGFDSDPYEGPDATEHGPLKWTSGKAPPVSHATSGYWGVPAFYQVGNAFVFETTIGADELERWRADATRGQQVTGSLAAMTFAFTWPSNVEALRSACPAKVSTP